MICSVVCSVSDEFGAIGRSLDGGLFLGVPIDDGLVEQQVEYSSDGKGH